MLVTISFVAHFKGLAFAFAVSVSVVFAFALFLRRQRSQAARCGGQFKANPQLVAKLRLLLLLFPTASFK